MIIDMKASIKHQKIQTKNILKIKYFMAKMEYHMEM